MNYNCKFKLSYMDLLFYKDLLLYDEDFGGNSSKTKNIIQILIVSLINYFKRIPSQNSSKLHTYPIPMD